MRLTPREADAIRECARRHFGERCVVRLFGSRVDDAARGGDIDLHIEAQSPQQASLARELEFKNELKELIGDQRIDVVVRPPRYQARTIDEIALDTGVRL
jgi:predicted nucleotidyltransferase